MALLLNLRFRIHPAHYALTLFCTLFTAFVALRQLALHVVPGMASYGPTSYFGISHVYLVIHHLYGYCHLHHHYFGVWYPI